MPLLFFSSIKSRHKWYFLTMQQLYEQYNRPHFRGIGALKLYPTLKDSGNTY